MWYGRVRDYCSAPQSTDSAFGKVEDFEEFWGFVQTNLKNRVYPFALPEKPRYMQQLTLLRHIGPESEFYICNVDSTVVWGYIFYSPFSNTHKVLEVWNSETEYAIPRDYWECNEPFSP